MAEISAEARAYAEAKQRELHKESPSPIFDSKRTVAYLARIYQDGLDSASSARFVPDGRPVPTEIDRLFPDTSTWQVDGWLPWTYRRSGRGVEGVSGILPVWSKISDTFDWLRGQFAVGRAWPVAQDARGVWRQTAPRVGERWRRQSDPGGYFEMRADGERLVDLTDANNKRAPLPPWDAAQFWVAAVRRGQTIVACDEQDTELGVVLSPKDWAGAEELTAGRLQESKEQLDGAVPRPAPEEDGEFWTTEGMAKGGECWKYRDGKAWLYADGKVHSDNKDAYLCVGTWRELPWFRCDRFAKRLAVQPPKTEEIGGPPDPQDDVGWTEWCVNRLAKAVKYGEPLAKDALVGALRALHNRLTKAGK